MQLPLYPFGLRVFVTRVSARIWPQAYGGRSTRKFGCARVVTVRVFEDALLWTVTVLMLLSSLGARCAYAQADKPPAPSEHREKQSSAKDDHDPFSDLASSVSQPEERDEDSRPAWPHRLFKENFGFRKEIMSQFDARNGSSASRQSVGFEAQKRFSTQISTVATFDFQARLVRRDGLNSILNDMEGESRPGWTLEYHNLYLDVYNMWNPLLAQEQRRKTTGKFNVRAGGFYVPFGLNLQTDTQGTVLQLSNEENFGFERDWYTGLWGSLNRHVDYNLHYLAGSGYDLEYKGQSGLGALRLSLANRYGAEHGVEGGVSFLGGERLAPSMSPEPGSVPAENARIIETSRIGIDGRYRHIVPSGLLLTLATWLGPLRRFVLAHPLGR